MFGAPAQPEPQAVRPPGWGWLAPAAAMFLLWASVWPKPPAGLAGWQAGRPTGLVAAIAFDRPNLVAYVDSKRHSDRNAWPGATLEWTNDSGSRTTPPPFLRTNGFIQ